MPNWYYLKDHVTFQNNLFVEKNILIWATLSILALIIVTVYQKGESTQTRKAVDFGNCAQLFLLSEAVAKIQPIMQRKNSSFQCSEAGKFSQSVPTLK